MESEQRLDVREARLEETDIRTDYLQAASEEYLQMLGVDGTLLLTREEMRHYYEEDYKRPVRDRRTFLLLWELDGEAVGFSSADRIAFGNEAFMHLHIVDPTKRRMGLGTEFVNKSAAIYFRTFELSHLYSEPNTFNVGANRTLQRAGFRYLFTHMTSPARINPLQPMTRWVLERK